MIKHIHYVHELIINCVHPCNTVSLLIFKQDWLLTVLSILISKRNMQGLTVVRTVGTDKKLWRGAVPMISMSLVFVSFGNFT